MSIELPVQISDLLQRSPVAGGIYTFLDKVSEVLVDNKTPFFPAFTDHGKTHIERVVGAAVRLVPAQVWERQSLTGADAAAIVVGCALHDFAMHLRENGFVELVSNATYTPLPWFNEYRGATPPDLPWPDAWAEFRREARHLSQSRLTRILGPGHDGIPSIVVDDVLPPPSTWTEQDRLLAGEFLRRHHARLAHEIALYGLPGADGEFPVLNDLVPAIANICGVIARSHNLSLREATDYVNYASPGNLRPSGVAATYVMALLRIADYLQLDADRAPTLLLRLRQPQSQVSIDEWNKHGAVASISWDHRDRAALYVDVTPNHSLRTHLQLGELLDGLQQELDATVAVLDETYTHDEDVHLRLARRRVYSNLNERSLHDRLPYVPRRAALRSAEDLFRLVVGDLYGHEPAVAGRELVQNAADAVRERARWEASHGPCPLPRLVDDADILVEIRDLGDDGAELVVADNGIGMTPDVVIDYFLQAGASLRPSAEDLADATPQQRVEWMRAGRFGVGAFAAFLLGPEIAVRTRHVGSDRGLTFRARIDGDLVQVDWADLPFAGTEIVVPFATPGPSPSTRRDPTRHAGLLRAVASFYVLRRPHARLQVVTTDGHVTVVEQPNAFPGPRTDLPDSWRRVAIPEFDDVQWSVGGQGREGLRAGAVCHNGVALRSPRPVYQKTTTYRLRDSVATRIVEPPGLSVFDSRHLLGVALHRYGLARDHVPFEEALLRSIGRDLVAHALGCSAPRTHPLGKGWGLRPIQRRDGWLPLIPDLVRRHLDVRTLVIWVSHEWRAHALTRRSLTTLRSAPWPAAPARLLLPVAGDSGMGDNRLAAYVLRTAVKKFAEVTGASHVCTVTSYPPGRRLAVVTDRDNRITYTIDSSATTREAALLDETWRELAEEDGGVRFGVSLFDACPDETTPVSPLADAWESLIDGFLPHPGSARAALADAVFASDAEMRDLAERWTRLAAQRDR